MFGNHERLAYIYIYIYYTFTAIPNRHLAGHPKVRTQPKFSGILSIPENISLFRELSRGRLPWRRYQPPTGSTTASYLTPRYLQAYPQQSAIRPQLEHQHTPSSKLKRRLVIYLSRIGLPRKRQNPGEIRPSTEPIAAYYQTARYLSTSYSTAACCTSSP